MLNKVNEILYVPEIDFQEKHYHTRVLYDDNLEELFRKHNIFSKINSKEQRFRKQIDYITFSNNAVIEPFSCFEITKFYHSIGSFSYSRSILPINTIVGRYCSIANGVRRMGVNHPLDRFTTSSFTYNKGIILKEYEKKHNLDIAIKEISTEEGPITIGNDVWIGQDVLFSSKGVRVHNGAVIAANSVVTKDVPAYAIVAGNPAKVVKYRFEKEVIEILEELQWWKYDLKYFNNIDLNVNIKSFINLIEKLDGRNTEIFKPTPLTLKEIIKQSNP